MRVDESPYMVIKSITFTICALIKFFILRENTEESRIRVQVIAREISGLLDIETKVSLLYLSLNKTY